MRKSVGQRIPEKEIVKQKFCKNFERGRLLVRRARRCNREDLEQFQFVWVTDRLRFGGCLRWFVGKGLDPSTGDNARPVRGVEDAVPYI